jgi:serine phosphatase RsbU (regulator of sigma subunit)
MRRRVPRALAGQEADVVDSPQPYSRVMAARPEAPPQVGEAVSAAAVRRFAEAVEKVAQSASLEERLHVIVDTLARELRSEIVVARVLDSETGELVARAVRCDSPSLAAELEGSRLRLEELGRDVGDPGLLGGAAGRAAQRASARAALQVPVSVAGRPLGSIELLRTGAGYSGGERQLALLAASNFGLVLATGGAGASPRSAAAANGAIEIAGDALAVGADAKRVGQTVARLAAEATGAQMAALWRLRRHELTLAVQTPRDAQLPGGAFQHAESALEAQRPYVLEREGQTIYVALRLGEPPLGVLQLGFAEGSGPVSRDLARLTTFAVRVANALRASEDAARVATDLERAQALLSVLDEAIAHLSLAHTLDTAVERVADLVSCERVAVYLLEEGRLEVAVGRGLEGDHVRVAQRLLELALGPFRARGIVTIEDAGWDVRLAGARDAAVAAGIESAVAVPLLVHEELIGLLAAYLPRGTSLSASEAGLLAALAVQLGVVVQNARLHERTKTLGEEREEALRAERRTARQLRALSEISGSFAESLDFDTTLRALAKTAVEALRVDAAVVRVPDERGETLVAQAFEAAEERLAAPLAAALSRPATLEALSYDEPGPRGGPIRVDAARAAALGEGYDVLVPFLERGSTAVIVPIASPEELLATLTLVSMDQERPISDEALGTALPLAAQAALALDKARLSQQQRQFFDTMQRSLLPQVVPETPGLEIGHLYEASARLDIGGDVYDLMTLPDGRLAAVIGDVTGHGIDAAADMAMVKYLFRSLAREHSRPGDFLAHANEVVVGEITAGKFVTMAYLIIDPARAVVACAAAGHPSPRLVQPDGTVTALPAGGLALGVEVAQDYGDVEEPLPPGAAVVLYTDGVLEARRAGEMYGEERLDALLARRAALPADRLARAILDDCRHFAGGELDDDAAVVVIKHAAA